jgi:hypothetical protein
MFKAKINIFLKTKITTKIKKNCCKINCCIRYLKFYEK